MATISDVSRSAVAMVGEPVNKIGAGTARSEMSDNSHKSGGNNNNNTASSRLGRSAPTSALTASTGYHEAHVNVTITIHLGVGGHQDL